MVIIQWSTRETVPTIGHRHLCHRVLYFRTFYMFSSTSIFKTRSPETTVRSDISNPPRVWPRDYMQLELRQGHPPNGQSDWCHLWFPMLESAEPKKRRNMFSNGALLEVWTIAYFHWSVTRTHIYIYRQYIYVDRECSTNTSCVCACLSGGHAIGVEPGEGICTLFSACWQLKSQLHSATNYIGNSQQTIQKRPKIVL